MRRGPVLAIAILCSCTFWSVGASAAGDAAAGEKVFNKCKACHSLKAGENKVGPSLAGVFGRQAGTADGFKFSDAMKASGLVWDDANIAAYLEKPKDYVPGNKMAFPGLKKADDRANLIEFLKSAAQ